MKALITGVTGMDGALLASFLLTKGYEVVGTARQTSDLSKIRHLIKNPQFKLIITDISNKSNVRELLLANKDIKELYNLSAQSNIHQSKTDPPEITMKSNVYPVEYILSTAKEMNTPFYFYQPGSSAMFGKSYSVRYTVAHNTKEFKTVKYQNEETVFKPESPYAASKVVAYEITKMYREQYGFMATNGILYNHSHETQKETFVVRKIAKWVANFDNWLKTLANNDYAFRDESIVSAFSGHTFNKLRLGNLESVKDFGVANDFVKSMWMARTDPDDYIICANNPMSIAEIATIAFKYIGINNWLDFVVLDSDLYTAASEYIPGDNSKANNVLGWCPTSSFINLIHRMIDYEKKL